MFDEITKVFCEYSRGDQTAKVLTLKCFVLYSMTCMPLEFNVKLKVKIFCSYESLLVIKICDINYFFVIYLV